MRGCSGAKRAEVQGTSDRFAEFCQAEHELDQAEPGAVCSEAAAQQEKEGGAWVRACGVWGVRPAIRLASRSVPGDVLTAQPARQARASRRWDWFSCRVVAVAQALAGYAWRTAWPGMPPARR